MDTMTAARSNVIVIVEVLRQESVLIDLLFRTFSPVCMTTIQEFCIYVA